MRITKKIILLIFLFAFLFILAGAGIRYLQSVQFDSLIKQEKHENAEFLNLILESKSNPNYMLAYDYTIWDEMVNFVKIKSQKWANINIYVSLSTFKADAALVFDKDFKLVFSTSIYSGEGKEFIPKKLPFSKELLKKDISKKVVSQFFAVIDGRLVKAYAAPINPSDDDKRETPAQGYFIVLKVWDNNFAESISKMAKAKLSIDLGNSPLSKESSGTEMDYFVVSKQLLGLDNRSVAVLNAQFSMADIKGVMRESFWFLQIVGVLSFVFLVFIGRLLVSWIVFPLGSISKTLKKQEPKDLEKFKNRKDEFGEISRLILDFFNTKKALEEEIHQHKEADWALKIQKDIAVAVSQKTGLKEILGTFLYEITKIEGVDSGGIYLYDPDFETLELFVHKGLPESFIKAVSHYTKNDPQTMAVLRGEPIFSNYIRFLKTIKLNPAEKEMLSSLKALAVIPIKYQDKIVAAINLASHHYEELPWKTRSLIETVSAQIGGVIARAKMEAEVSESQQSLLSFYNSTLDYIFVLDLQGNILDANASAVRMFGYTEEELREKHIFQLHPNEAPEQLREMFSQVIAGKTMGCAMPLVTKSGQIIEAESQATKGVWLGKEVVFCISKDVTERRKNEEALRNKDAVLESVSFAAEQFLKQSDWEKNISDILKKMGKAANVQRVYVFKNEKAENSQMTYNEIYEWIDSSVSVKIDKSELQKLYYGETGVSRWQKELSNNKPIYGNVKDFPKGEQDILFKQGIKAVVGVPIFVNNVWWGFMGFDECLNERKWSLVEIDALKTAGDMFGAALSRMYMQKVLEESEKNYKEIFENSPNIIVLYDKAGKIVSVNHRIKELLGYETNEIIGIKLDELPFAAEESRKILKDKYEQRILGKHVEEYEVEFINKNSAPVIMLVKGTLIKKENDVYGTLITLTDITEKKKLQNFVEENEKKYRSIFDNSPETIVLVDNKGIILDINKKIESVVGYKREAAIGENLLELPFMTAEGKKIIYENFAKRMKGEAVAPYEVEFKHRNGRAVYAILSGTPIESRGKIVGTLSVVSDITEEKKLQKIVEESEKKYKELFADSPETIAIFGIDGGLQEINKKVTDLLGLQAEELIGRNFMEFNFVTEESRLELKPIFMELVSGKITEPYELEMKKKDGTPVYALLRGTPITENGTVTKIMVVLTDITEKKSAENRVKEIINLKSQFISMVSHELRTPLTSIKEGIGIVADESAGELNDEQKDFLNIAIRNVERLGRLINEVLDFQKIEAGKMSLNLKPCNINSIIKETADMMKSEINSKNLELKIIPDDSLEPLNIDKDKIIQVLTNLLNNAAKFTEHGSITIMVEHSGNTATVSVKDTGKGIKGEDLDKLFKSFSQLQSSETRKPGGTGLGLAISKSIIEMHGGKIWAESVYGEGTTFKFLLPIKEQRAAYKPQIF